MEELQNTLDWFNNRGTEIYKLVYDLKNKICWFYHNTQPLSTPETSVEDVELSVVMKFSRQNGIQLSID